MIKLTKHNGKEYIVVNTEIQAGDSTAPVIIQISLKDVSEDDKFKIYQTASLLLNRTIKRPTPRESTPDPYARRYRCCNCLPPMQRLRLHT